MNKHLDANDDVQLDQLLAKAKQAHAHNPNPQSDALLKARIIAALPTSEIPIETARPGSVLDELWQWFAQPLWLAAAAMLPLVVGFVLGNATQITDSELLLALSEQDSWAVEQMLEDTQWSQIDE